MRCAVRWVGWLVLGQRLPGAICQHLSRYPQVRPAVAATWTGTGNGVVSKRRHPPRVLMLGPARSVKGGVTTVEELYFRAWDYSRYSLRHVGTYTEGNKLEKLVVAARALAIFVYYLVFWRPDIVHVHFSLRASFFRKAVFILVARLWGIKTLIHCHASAFDTFYEEAGLFGRAIIRAVLNQADRLIVLSPHSARFFGELQLRVPVTVLSNPIVCHAPVERPRRSAKVVLSLGRLGCRKGTYDILRAIPTVLETSEDAQFWLCGDGETDRIRSILAGRPWRQQVKLLGWVVGTEKDRVLAEASVFILPSYAEGLPMAILEAMAYGLPVISTPVGGIPEAVINGKTGFLVDPGDVQALSARLSLLLENPELCRELGANARQLVEEKFQVDAILRRLYTLYEACLGLSQC